MRIVVVQKEWFPGVAWLRGARGVPLCGVARVIRGIGVVLTSLMKRLATRLVKSSRSLSTANTRPLLILIRRASGMAATPSRGACVHKGLALRLTSPKASARTLLPLPAPKTRMLLFALLFFSLYCWYSALTLPSTFVETRG